MQGPLFNVSKINTNCKLDTSFRLLIAYIPTIDSIVCRIDVKTNGKLYNIGLATAFTPDPPNGVPISINDDLIFPKKSVEGGVNLKVNKIELIQALKELISDLETEV